MLKEKDNVRENNGIRVNGIEKFGSTKENNETSIKMWNKLQANEWSISFLLLLISLTVIIVKLSINYGNVWKWFFEDHYSLVSIPALLDLSSTLNISNISNLPEIGTKQLATASAKFINVSSQYEEAVANAVVTYYDRYGWLIKAMISGLIMTGFTWYIIYKDSTIPGINPPFPVPLFKQSIKQSSNIQANYLIGVLNGILIFIYMCL